MTRYGVPYWLARVPTSKRPSCPRYRGVHETEVAIIGGGFAGIAAAYVFSSARIRTVVLEAGRLGQGATAGASGVVRAEPDLSFDTLVARHGRRAAHEVWGACRRGATDLASALRRLKIRCDLRGCDSILLAVASEEEQRLRREYRARRAAGVEGAWWGSGKTERETRVPARAALRAAPGTLIDPYRACLGLLRAATSRGAEVYERSPVLSVKTSRSGVALRTESGTLNATTVIVATGTPGRLFKPLARHLSLRARFGVVTSPIDRPLGRDLGRGRGTGLQGSVTEHVLVHGLPAWQQVRWTPDGRLMAMGDDAGGMRSRSSSTRQGRDLIPAGVLVQRGGQLMYEMSLLYPAISGIPADFVWAIPQAASADGLPYAGPHRNYPHHLFAFGCGDASPAFAFVSARILLRQYLGTSEKHDELFGFGR
jgi:glycine/D-amino acid oxidase-like deaminating enzyme